MESVKQLIVFVIIIIVTSCSTKSNTKAVTKFQTDSLIKKDTVKNNIEVLNDNEETATYYVIIADTGRSYANLHKQMFTISKKMQLEIDTMGRYYNKKKNLIALPDNAEDEIYAGDYFPRRFPSASLSLEYLTLYLEKSNEKTIALVAGIFEDELSADSCFMKLKNIEKKAFKVKAELFIGCMH